MRAPTRFVALGTRRPVATAFVVALGARLVVVTGLLLLTDGLVFPAEVQNLRLAHDVLDGTSGEWSRFEAGGFRNASAFILVLAGLIELTGADRLTGSLLVALLGAGTAGATTALAGRYLDRRWALGAGLVVALFPSQVFFSALVLKDAAVWLTAIVLAIAVTDLHRADSSRRRVVLAAGVVCLLVLMAFLRPQTLAVGSIAVAGTAAWSAGTRRRWSGVAVAAAAVVVLAGFIALNSSARWMASGNVEAISQYRQTLARQGDLDVVEEQGDARLVALVRHLPRGVSVILLEPYPWQATDGPLDAARIEAVLWYPLLVLGVGGTVVALRRHGAGASFPVLYAVGLVLVYALIEGNLGTAYRHRGDLVWVVAIMAAVAGSSVRQNSRRARIG